MDLENKIIFITGSSSGIGEQIAYAFSKEKSKVIITYRSNFSDAEKIADECRRLGSPETFLINLDLRNNESIRDCAKKTEEKFGHIDFLINNAGVINWEKFDNETFEEIENQIRTNLEGMIKITLAFIPQIKEGIINMASRAGHVAFPGRVSYAASKSGVIGFTKSLALEYPDLKIFSVSPGAVKTRMVDFDSGIDPEDVAGYVIKALKGEVDLKDWDLNIWQLIN